MRLTTSQFAKLRPKASSQLKQEIKVQEKSLRERISRAPGIGATLEAATGNVAENELYALLCPVYRSYADGGDLVRELIPLGHRDFRLDVALPRYKIGLELDGYQDHGAHIAGFKRDREKVLHLVSAGWLVIQCMYSHVKSEPDLVLSAVAAAVARSEKNNYFTIDRSRAYPTYAEIKI